MKLLQNGYSVNQSKEVLFYFCKETAGGKFLYLSYDICHLLNIAMWWKIPNISSWLKCTMLLERYKFPSLVVLGALGLEAHYILPITYES